MSCANETARAILSASRSTATGVAWLDAFIEHHYPDQLIPSKSTNTPKTLVKLLGNWASPSVLQQQWGRMAHPADKAYSNFQLVGDDEKAEWFVILNAPPSNVDFDAAKTIVYQMEPRMAENPAWGVWANPSTGNFAGVYVHSTHSNLWEWHLSLSNAELRISRPLKTHHHVLSAILSDKYTDPGHVKRVNFVKYMEAEMRRAGSALEIHVFGANGFVWDHYMGALPPRCKDDGIFPYKYHLAIENQAIDNYVTEKLIDGILGESLVFYYGAPNIAALIDPRAYVQLPLDQFDEAYACIQQAMQANAWETRIPFIRAAKARILHERNALYTIYKQIHALQMGLDPMARGG